MCFILRWVFISCVIYFRNVVAQNVSGAAPDYIPSCTMPSNPENGMYTIGDDPAGTFKPGTSISAYSSLRVICNFNYKPSPPDRPGSICVEGQWLPDPPECSLFCDGMNPSESTIVTCSFKGRRLQSCANPVEDTKAFITCEVLYENINLRENPFRVCKDGGWDRPFLQCNKVVTTTTPLPRPERCLMPDNPANGVYTIADNSPGTFEPGTFVNAYSVLNVICNEYYKRFPPEHPVSLCVDGKWVAEPPQCSRACSSIVSSNTTKVSCTFKGRPLQSCMDPVKDTIATLSCEHLHEDVSIEQYPSRICQDGSWDRPFPHCKPVVTTTTPLARPERCLMPDNPANGVYTIADNSPGTFKPGTFVSAYSVLNVICNEYYKRFPPEHPVSLCVHGRWVVEPPQCSRACSSIVSSNTTKVSCTFKGRPLQSCMNPVNDTIATLSCEHQHEDVSIEQYPSRICQDGSWDPVSPFPHCQPVCGLKRLQATPLTIGGKMNKVSNYPWHVGIYNVEGKTHVCGGSIVNERVILSAAHCFTNLSNGQQFPKENYLIAAGKYYQMYGDLRDSEFEQHTTIENIYIPVRYKGDISLYGLYEADLAVVVLKTNLVFSLSVQPVCIDWSKAFEYQQLTSSNPGLVLGWSHSREGDLQTEELKEWYVHVIPYEQCYKEVPKSFRRFLTYDKTCAKVTANNTTTYEGDSGGGLVLVGHNGRYFLRGIVSTSPKNSDVNQYTLLSKHIDFIKLHM